MADPIKILMVEDNPADIRLIKEFFNYKNSNNQIFVVNDPLDALNFFNKYNNFQNVPDPDLKLLDLNLQKKDDREFLKEIKENYKFKYIRKVILTTSSSNEDILRTYRNLANFYNSKTVDVGCFLIRYIDYFWRNMIELHGS
jgi:CheY-like chemotaxis protein